MPSLIKQWTSTLIDIHQAQMLHDMILERVISRLSHETSIRYSTPFTQMLFGAWQYRRAGTMSFRTQASLVPHRVI
jgi:hypothetical protein